MIVSRHEKWRRCIHVRQVPSLRRQKRARDRTEVMKRRRLPRPRVTRLHQRLPRQSETNQPAHHRKRPAVSGLQYTGLCVVFSPGSNCIYSLVIQPRSGYIMTNTCFGAEFVAYSVRALYAICGRSRVQIQAASSFSAFLTVNRCVNRRQLRPTKGKRSFMTNLITVATGYGLLK